MMLLSMVAIKFCFVLDTHDTDAIAINKLCKLNFRYFTMYLTSHVLSQHKRRASYIS